MEVCYRHPNRETGVACSSCGRPICPDCMTPTPVGMRCPECSRQRTKVARVRAGSVAPTATYMLIALNTIIELVVVLSGGSTTGGGGTSTLLAHGELYSPDVADGQVWRLLTAGFLHAGFLHLLFNMYALYILGTLLEPAIGRTRFLLIYFVSLFAGSFGALLLSPNSPTVGASGAIFGLFGAAVVIGRNRGNRQLARVMLFWIAFNLIFTVSVPGISIGGHLGGLVGGTLVALIMFELPSRLRAPGFAEYVAPVASAAIGALAIAGSIAVAG